MMQLMTGGPAMGAEKGDPELLMAQRRLLSKMLCIQEGIQGVAKAVAPPQKSQIDVLSQRIDALVEAAKILPEDEPDLYGLAKSVRAAVREIEAETKRLQPPPPTSGLPGAGVPGIGPPSNRQAGS